MPVYEYEILGPDGSVHGVYEVEQKMSDPPLTAHPVTGAPLRRILSSTFASAGSGSDLGCASGGCGIPSSNCEIAGGPCGGGGCGGGGWN